MTVVWLGDEVRAQAVGVLVSSLDEFGGRWETAAKGSVRPGRGVVTGTYRRSLHSGPPNYNYANDNVRPSHSSPERGSGGGGGAEAEGDSILMLLGSGMVYARKLEERYNVVVGAYEKTAGQMPGIVAKKAKAAGLL